MQEEAAARCLCAAGTLSLQREDLSRRPPLVLEVELLSFVSSHYCSVYLKPNNSGRTARWCDKMIFLKSGNPTLYLFCCSAAALEVLTQADTFVWIKKHLFLDGDVWQMTDYLMED